jgi:hypothetical protein
MESVLTLFDLDTEILCNIFSQLRAHNAAATSCSCKLAWLLCSEVQRDVAQATFLSSQVKFNLKSCPPERVLDSMRELASQMTAPPTMGLLFTTPRLFAWNKEQCSAKGRRAACTRLMHQLPPSVHLIGGEVDTLLGTCADGSLATVRGRGYALTLGGFPEAPAGSFIVESSSSKVHRGGAFSMGWPEIAQLEEQGAFEPGWKVMVVLSVGNGVHRLEGLLGKLQAVHPQAAIIGGLATGDWLLRANGHQVRFLEDGLVGLMFRGNVPLHALVCKGECLPRLQHAKREIAEQGRSLLGGLMFTCTARDARADAGAFRTVFPRSPLAGMPCGGEIGPRFRAVSGGPSGSKGSSSSSSSSSCSSSSSNKSGESAVASAAASGACATQAGEVALQGYTAVFGLFSVPTRTRSPSDVHYEDVHLAYTEARRTPETVALAAAATAAAAARAAAAAAALEAGEDECDEEDAFMDEEDGEEEEEDGEEDEHVEDDGEEEEWDEDEDEDEDDDEKILQVS